MNGLILAGGKSSRMQQDKSAMLVHGVTQVKFLTDLLAPFVDQVFVSTRAVQADLKHFEGYKLIIDKLNVESPLNGIISAMKTDSKISWLVIAVDMPNITAEAIKVLIENHDKKAVATCFEMPIKGGPDPLFAIWEAHALPLLEEIAVNKTEHICPRFVLKTLGANIIKNAVPDKVLANLNTPDDLQEYAA